MTDGSNPKAVSSVEELVALALGPTYSGELPLGIAKQLLRAHSVSSGVMYELAQVGLAKRIGDAWHTARQQAGGPEETREEKNARKKAELARVNKKIAAVISRHIRVLRDIALECDGRLKSLYVFTPNDIQNWIARSEKHANGWARRAAWFHAAEGAIRDHKKSVLSELPDRVLRKLSAEAEEAWSDAA